jgi:hypothetical protein
MQGRDIDSMIEGQQEPFYDSYGQLSFGRQLVRGQVIKVDEGGGGGSVLETRVRNEL